MSLDMIEDLKKQVKSTETLDTGDLGLSFRNICVEFGILPLTPSLRFTCPANDSFLLCISL